MAYVSQTFPRSVSPTLAFHSVANSFHLERKQRTAQARQVQLLAREVRKSFGRWNCSNPPKFDGQYFHVGFMPFFGKLRLKVMVKVDPKRYSFTSGLPLYNLNLSLLHRFQSACLHVLGHIASLYFEGCGVVNSLHLANQI